MAEVTCKFCAMSIPLLAKVCPYCRKKQPQGIKSWHVILAIFVGWFFYTWVSAPSLDSYKEKAQQAKKEIDNVPLSDKGKKIKTKHPDWTNVICNLVAGKQIEIGMTDEQVRASWGKPTNINSTTTSSGDREQWVYGEIRSDYVYFKNGVMTTLQQSK